MIFRFIDAEKASFTIDFMCPRLGVSVSGYYAWKKREDLVYLAQIRACFAESRKTYGSPRVHAELKGRGLAIGRHRTARLMRDNRLQARPRRRFKRTTDSEHAYAVAPDLLEQDFSCTHADQKWSVDISYVWTAEGWLYLAIVLDLFSRRIVGWAVSDRLKTELATTALKRALALRQPLPGLIHHSDRGSQYCSADYQRLLACHRIIPSMSRRGNCWDNAIVETVFKTLKSDLVWRTSFASRSEAARAIGDYIEGFYNCRRRHSALGYQAPIAFEMSATAERVSLH